MKGEAKLLIVEPFEKDFPREVKKKLRCLYELYRKIGEYHREDKEIIVSKKQS